MLSDVVYSVKCKDCGQLYIGKTERQCIRRLQERELRRSARLKNKTTTTTTTTATTTTAINLDQAQTSSIEKHIIETGHNMDWRNFNVVCRGNDHYR
ncbi:unnamed protein product, partial [Rotaria magnacalcarata]